MKVEPWMMDYFDDADPDAGTLTYWCKPCTEKNGVKISIVWHIKNSDSQKSVDQFLKRHHWCNKDKEFQLTKWAIDLQRELTDAEKSFCRECIKENWSYDEILKRLKEPRHVMPSRSIMKNLF